MINYRLSLLIIIFLTGLGWAPNSNAKVFWFKQTATQSKVETVAQVPTTNTQNPSGLGDNSSQYNRLMQEGYQATKDKNYQKAKEKFTQALKERPNNIHAEQALQNVEIYLSKQANPLSVLTSNWLLLLLGLIVITGGFGLAFWLFFRRSSPYPKERLEEELLIPQQEEEYFEPILKTPEKSSFKEQFIPEKNGLKPKKISDSPIDQSALTIESTTRIPSRDPIERLIDDLQETDPKKRRKAIWGLAQKADSRAMKPLVDLMIDTDSQERSLILEALSQISARTLKPMNQALAISLKDKNPQVRKNAIRDLTRIYEFMSQISQLLCHAIDDTDRDVQDTAKWAISQLNTQMPPRLDILNRDANPEVTVEQSYSDSMEEI